MAKLLQSTLFQSKGALMKVKKSRVLSAFVTIALVASMLPLGAMTAFAATNFSSSTSVSVVRGVGNTQAQEVNNITIKEDSSDYDAWNTYDTACTVVAGTGVTFSGKPTITVNGTAIGSSNITLDGDRDTVTYYVSGVDGSRDTVVISNINVNVASTATGSTMSMTCSDPAGGSNGTPEVAKIKDGIIFGIGSDSTTGKNKEVTIGENNQTVGTFTLVESTTDTLDADNTISITCPDGVTFYESPRMTDNTSFALQSEYASVSPDRKTATWTVATADNTNITTMTVSGCAVNLASTIPTGTDIKFSFATSNSDYAIAPTPAKVAEAVSGDDISITADSAPTISKTTNQAVGSITVKESKEAVLTEGSFTMTIDSTGAAFASTPQATPTGGLLLTESDGDDVSTAVAGSMSKTGATKLDRATWTIGGQSTASSGGTIAISGIALNVDSTATTGSIRMILNGCGMVNKPVTVGYISSAANYTVTSSGSPAIKVNTGDQAAGDIVITELKAGTLASGSNGLVLKIFGNTSDNEVQFSEAPVVSIVSGNIDLASSGALSTGGGANDTFTLAVDAVSTKVSTIKISGIKYDVNAKATEGGVQVVVSNGSTRLATVTNANISKTGQTFSDVASTFWASSYIDKLNTKGIINGYNDGTFKPNNTITRAEFAKIAVTAAGLALSTTATASFSDVPTTHWAFKYIETAKAAGFIGGYPDGTFRPDAQVNRAEICKMVIGAGKIATDTAGSGFSDTAGNWAEAFIKTAAKSGIVGGYPDGTFGPAKNATRAEAAKMVSTWLKL